MSAAITHIGRGLDKQIVSYTIFQFLGKNCKFYTYITISNEGLPISIIILKAA